MTSTEMIVGVDAHVQEPPDLWTSRLPKSRWGDRVPHIEDASGVQKWVVEGQAYNFSETISVGSLMADPMVQPRSWDEVPKAAYDPAEHLKAMDLDGIQYEVLYPTVSGSAGERLGAISDPELELACVQAYNDWIIDEWVMTSPRFVPQCLVPLSSVEQSVRELRRAVERGHRGLIYPPLPTYIKDLPHINSQLYNPLWEACVELDVPICFHAGVDPSLEFPPYSGFSPRVVDAMSAVTRSASSIQLLGNFLLSPIPQLYPGLKVIFAESSLAWGAYSLETADHQFERQRLYSEGYTASPSEVFGRQCYLTGWYDKTALGLRSFLGVDHMMWQTSFPNTTSTWPGTQQTVARCFAGVSEEDKAKILFGNAAKMYRLQAQ